MAASDHMTFTLEHIPNHSRSGKGVLQVNLIYPMHQLKISWPCRPGLVVCARSRELQDTALLRYRQLMIAVYHLFALSLPALQSACPKKSFSRVSSPIWACSSFMSGSLPFLGPSKTVEAPSSTCCFQSDIWLGCTSNCSANSTSVLSPLIAANATFALKFAIVVPSCPSHALAPFLDPISSSSLEQDPLINLSDFAEPLLSSTGSTRLTED